MGIKFNPFTVEFDLVGSSSSTDSFTTIQPDEGSSPTASTSSSTLTLTSSDSSVVITGDSGTDTIDFSATGAASASFKTIDTPNGSSPVASTSTDTLTYTSNDGIITITGSSADKSVDFAYAGTQFFQGTNAPTSLLGKLDDTFINTSTGEVYKKTSSVDLPITANLDVDINPDAIAGNDGDSISAFTESSGNGYTFSQATGGMQPILKLGILLTHSCLRFDGSRRIVADSYVPDPTKQYTIYIVAKANSGNSNCIISTLNDSSYDGIEAEMYFDVGGGVYGFTALNGGSGNTFSGSTSNATATYITWLKKATSGAAGVNTVRMAGVSLGNSGSGTQPATNDSNLCVGSINATGSVHNALTGDIYRILIYEGIHTGGQITTMESYLNDSYFGSGGTGWTKITTLLTNSLTSAQLLVGNSSNIATARALSGDVTIGNTGVTAIGASKVSNTMLIGSIASSKLIGSDIATVGTITAGTWNGSIIPDNYLPIGNPQLYSYMFDDFISTSATAGQGWSTTSTGTGAVTAQNSTVLDNAHFGIWAMTPGTTTTGVTALRQYTNALIFGGGSFTYKILVDIVTLSNATDEYVLRFGTGTSVTQATDHQSGIYHEYNRAYTFTCSGTTTSGQTGVTGLSTFSGVVDINSIQATMAITGTGIQASTTVSSVNTGASTLILSQTATANGTVTLTFTVGNFWIKKTADNNTRSTAVSNVAVTTGWHTLSATVNAAGTSASYSVDSSSMGTLTTNIPVTSGSSHASGPLCVIYKTAGTTGVTFYIDYWYHILNFTSAR